MGLVITIDQMLPAVPGAGIIEPIDPRQPVGFYWKGHEYLLGEMADNAPHLDNLHVDTGAVYFRLPDGGDEQEGTSICFVFVESKMRARLSDVATLLVGESVEV